MNLTRIDVDKVNKHKNGRGYSLEKQVSNHRQAIEDLTDCSNHITVSIPDDFQRAEFLTDSIHCQDVTLQASIGLIRSDVNNMRNILKKQPVFSLKWILTVHDVEIPRPPLKTLRLISILAGEKLVLTSVNILKNNFMLLEREQRDELVSWQKTPDGRSALPKSRRDKDKNSNKGVKRKSDAQDDDHKQRMSG